MGFWGFYRALEPNVKYRSVTILRIEVSSAASRRSRKLRCTFTPLLNWALGGDDRVRRNGLHAMNQDALRIWLFDGLGAEFAERSVSRFRSEKAAALLAYLAFHRGRLQERDVLVEIL